ncbi:MAG: putative porin, partial [Candidatus Omnitrophota bacterium]
IRPEGAAVHLSRSIADDFCLFVNSGAFVLDESSSDTSNPYMIMVQPGFEWDIFNNISLKGAFTYYEFDNVKGSMLDNSNATNSFNVAPLSGLMYDYDSIAGAVDLGIKGPFGNCKLGEYIPYIGAFGDCVNNLDPDAGDFGWFVGVKLGYKKVGKPREYQFAYSFRRLEKDAWLDAFPDSDCYSGDTDIRAHEFTFKYALLKNVLLGIDYYQTKNLTGTELKEDLVQTDLELKF